MLRINQSTLSADEDAAVDLYDEAIIAFKKASALSPGKSIKFPCVPAMSNDDAGFYRKP